MTVTGPFRTSEGYSISRADNGEVIIRGKGGTKITGGGMVGQALGEYVDNLVAQNDAALGRWRYPMDPQYVVYAYGRDVINVMSERNGSSTTHRREDVEACLEHPQVADSEIVARAYFEVHPERKPWRDAQPGELWDVVSEGKERRYAAIMGASGEGEVVFLLPVNDLRAPKLGLNASVITGGRKVFPQDAS
ncbi:hypothetical protein [Microbacterium sp. NPDC089696]|uniref:hypothetical protein n=1 Tax=Microbacterium sp. NPDC089696 TaxID=3364199 RepID=UPI00382BB542